MNDDNSKKFIARPYITMQMAFTPEQYAFMQEWSAMVPTLYMLDICVVSAIKLTEESLKEQPRKAHLIAKLRNWDRDYNSFSYLLALMEKVSDSRGTLTANELEEQIRADVSALREFFKKAPIVETDDFLIDFLRTLMGQPIESKRAEYLEFLKSLNNHFLLQNSISSKQRLDKAKKIIHKAESLNIRAKHNIVIIALACLYGNTSAKKLMKFKADPNKFDAENVLADIMLIFRFAEVKLAMESYWPRVILITDDSALGELMKFFKPSVLEYSDKIDHQERRLTMDIELKSLLTEVTEDDYESIVQLLSS